MKKQLCIYTVILFLSSGLASAQNWTLGKVTRTIQPQSRFGAAFANDPARGNNPMFGGLGASPGGPLTFDDMWTLGANGWTSINPSVRPSARFGAQMVYVPSLGTSILFGGALWINNDMCFTLGDTWAWNGSNWAQLSPATSPSPRYLYSLAYDSVHGQLVMFGGFTGSGWTADTWVFDGTTWTQKFPAHHPSTRSGAAMVFDNNSNAILLFGGVNHTNSLSDTWLWNGTDWTQLTPATVPAGRYGAGIAYDVAQGQTIMFAGTNAVGNLADTWAWNGSNWTQLNPATSPMMRFYTMMDFDPMLNKVLMFGGGEGSTIGDIYLSDTWSWQ